MSVSLLKTDVLPHRLYVVVASLSAASTAFTPSSVPVLATSSTGDETKPVATSSAKAKAASLMAMSAVDAPTVWAAGTVMADD